MGSCLDAAPVAAPGRLAMQPAKCLNAADAYTSERQARVILICGLRVASIANESRLPGHNGASTRPGAAGITWPSGFGWTAQRDTVLSGHSTL